MKESPIVEVGHVRTEYTSARHVFSNLRHRLAGTRYVRFPGYIAPETDVVYYDGTVETLAVRDADVRYLDRVPRQVALKHMGLICRARAGDRVAAEELDRRMAVTHAGIARRFASQSVVDNEFVLPYTSARIATEDSVSHKGSVLLDLSRRGFATADFSILTAEAYGLPDPELEACARGCLGDLEILSGRRLGDPRDPLLVAVRSALPEYVPGFMPTYLNVGLTPAVIAGLPDRYGVEAAVRIRLNSRKTLLEALDPETFAGLEDEIRPGLTLAENEALARRLEALISRRDAELLADPFAQVLFCLRNAYAYYADHLGVLQNFMLRQTHYPAVIMQRMVCSVIDDESYAGVVYSRHPQLGEGVLVQFARTIYGEDLMTGRAVPEERHLRSRDEARQEFPAVYHFWNRLAQLEDLFRGPVMVEFTGVHGTFTILQVDAAELSGPALLTTVMDMHREGRLPAERVVELIKPYHVRQIESDYIDPRSLRDLTPFARGTAVLPQSDVTGRLYFSIDRAEQAREAKGGAQIVLAKARFTPRDAIDMQKVGGICSLSPAAIHVVTAAQGMGIPALLDLEQNGVRLDDPGRRLVAQDGAEIREGDWVTISSRHGTLFVGRPVYASARLLRLMAGEPVALDDEERPRFEGWAVDYKEYRGILESVDAASFRSLQDFGRAIRYGALRDNEARATELVNRSFELHADDFVASLLDGTLGSHLVHRTAFYHLTEERRARLLCTAAARCMERGLSGYQAGAFLVGSLVEPESPVAFWRQLPPREIAFLVNEWVLYQKYVLVLEDVGESQIHKARGEILSGGLASRSIPRSTAGSFVTLKLAGVDLAAVRRLLPEEADPQTAELIDSLRGAR